MVQTDKERLAVSTAIALLLYAGVFAATARLELLNPAEPVDYPELVVEVILHKPEPRTILPPVIETPPPEVRPEPVVTKKPEPAPQPIPKPVTAPSTQAAAASPAQTSPAASTRTGATSAGANSAAAAAVAIAPATTPTVAQSAPQAATGAATRSQAVPVQTPQYFGESEAISSPVSETGSEYFESVREGAVTDQFGEERIVYGTPEPSASRQPAAQGPAQTSNKPAFVDLNVLNSVTFAGEGAGDGGGTGSGTGQGTQTGPGEVIEAESLSELMSQRLVEQSHKPDIRNLGLPGGLRSMNVWVEFVIRRDGVVVQVKVADTGDSRLNSKIGEALRRWKFEPIAQNIQQVARLLYVIEATD